MQDRSLDVSQELLFRRGVGPLFVHEHPLRQMNRQGVFPSSEPPPEEFPAYEHRRNVYSPRVKRRPRYVLEDLSDLFRSSEPLGVGDQLTDEDVRVANVTSVARDNTPGANNQPATA